MSKTDRLRAGAHLIRRGVQAIAANDQGVITSVAFSPSLDHWVGLGFITGGPDRIGEHCVAADPVRDTAVEVAICQPCFLDPEGERLRV